MGNNIDKSSPSSTPCDKVLDLIPAYALGAADPEEKRFVEQHLKDCPEALSELQLYSELNDVLLFDTPPLAAPPELGKKIALIPNSPVKPTAAPSAPESKILKIPPIIWAAAAVVLVLLVGSNLYWLNQISTLEAERNKSQSLLAVLSATDSTFTQLTSASATSELHGTVTWHNAYSVALLRVNNLPTLSTDNEYQLWLLHDGQRISGGTFSVDIHGNGTLIFESEIPIEQVNAFGITLEPAGGSDEPTTSPILLGEI